MTAPDGRWPAAADKTTEMTLRDLDPGMAPATVSGVVRVSQRLDDTATEAVPARLPVTDRPSPARSLRDVQFPTAWRGYDPSAVDAYVRQVAQALEALEEDRTPQDVVRRALDRVGEETAAILREAEETAHRITTKSRSEAAERVQKAEREAHEITQRARARLRELDADIDRIWLERQRIIDDTRKLADGLGLIADHAEERFPAEELEVGGRSASGDEPDAGATGPDASASEREGPSADAEPADDSAAG